MVEHRISYNEIMVIGGHVIYGSVLLIGSLLIKNFHAKIWIYPLGLGLGHLFIFFPGILEVVRQHERKSVIIFFIGFQFLLIAQDMYILKIYGDPKDGGGIKNNTLLDAFFYIYITCESVGLLLIMSCIYWIQFFDPTKIGKASLLKFFMVFGILLGIAGSALYSLASDEDALIHYIGNGLIGIAAVIYGFGFFAGRFNWLKPPQKKFVLKNQRRKEEKEPLMKRIIPVKVAQPAPSPDRYV